MTEKDANMPPSAEQTTPPRASSAESYMGFAIKVAIVTVAFVVGAAFMADALLEALVNTERLQPLKERIRKATRDERTRIRLKGLLTTNPAVHYRVAAIEEAKGNFAAASEEIELALGLLELHGADRQTKERYLARLQELKRKQDAQPASGKKR